MECQDNEILIADPRSVICCHHIKNHCLAEMEGVSTASLRLARCRCCAREVSTPTVAALALMLTVPSESVSAPDSSGLTMTAPMPGIIIPFHSGIVSLLTLKIYSGDATVMLLTTMRNLTALMVRLFMLISSTSRFPVERTTNAVLELSMLAAINHLMRPRHPPPLPLPPLVQPLPPPLPPQLVQPPPL